jgi:hypothetical protein
MVCIASRGRYPSAAWAAWSIGIIDDRDDGKAVPSVSNQRSTSGSSRRPDPPEPRAFGASDLRLRPDFSNETWLFGFFIESLFDVCSATENQRCPLILMDLPVILQYQNS